MIMLLVACSTDEADNPSISSASMSSAALSEDITDIIWEWQQLNITDPSSQSMIANSAKYTLVFAQDGRYTAVADCNVVQGVYEASGDQLTFSIGAPALTACGADASACQYLLLLAQVDSYKIEEGRLVLSFGKGAGQIVFGNAGRVEAGQPLPPNADQTPPPNEEQPQPPSNGGDGGNSDDGNKKVTICHTPNGKNPVTIEVSQSALSAHLGHGDVQGSCQ